MKGLMHQLFRYNIEFYAVEHTKGKTTTTTATK